MYGSGEAPSANGANFAGQLITMYTDTLGSWAYPLIGIAALTTMFSTTLTCLDAYPRTLEESYFIWTGQANYEKRKNTTKTVYRRYLVAAVLGTLVIFFLIKNISGAMSFIVTLATVVSFISAPIYAFLNHKVMQGDTIKEADKPRRGMTRWAHYGVAIMVVFSLSYVVILLNR